MKKLQILIVVLLVILSICAFAGLQVKAQLVIDVSVSVSGSLVDRGVGTSILTADASGGFIYSYQWMMKAPGQTVFSNIPGAIDYTYTFAPSSSATIGTYLFEVDVTDLLTQSSAMSSPVSVAVSALPTVSVSPAGPITLTAGQVQVFSATPSGGSGVIHYKWYLGGSVVSSATGSTYSFNGSVGSYSVTCRVTDSASVPVTSGASNAVSVVVNAVPSVVLLPASWTMDVGQSKTFSATASGGSGSYTSYRWYVGGVVQVGATASTFSYSPASAGSYAITVTVTDSLAVTSAESSAASVTVAASPSVSIVPVGPVKMDVGQVKVFSASGSGGFGSLSYQWYLDGSAVGGNSASYSYNAAGSSHSVTCRVTDSASVPVTSGASNAVSVVVSPALVAPTVSSTPGTVNQGQTSSLTSTVVSTGTSPYTYQWLQRAPGAGSYSLISGATSSSYSFVTSGSTATGSWSFELQVTDSALAVVTSNAVSVVVNAVPSVVLLPASWTMDVGQSKTFSASASGGSGSYSSYQWYVGGLAQSGATASTFIYVPLSDGSYSITVTVTDSLATTSDLSSAVSVTVNSALVAPTVTSTPGTVNRGQTSSLSSSVASTGTFPYTYRWLSRAPGAGSYSLISGATSSSYSFSTTSSTAIGSWSFELRVTDAVSSVVTSSAVSVTVNSALVAPSVSASVGVINQGQSSVLSNSSSVTTGSSPYSYRWLSRAPGAGSYSLISGATSSSYSFVTSISTATGSWSFILQVSDAVGVVVNSSAVSVMVNIPPLDHFIFSSIATQTAGTSFSVTIMAKDASNNTLPNFVGSNTLNVSNGTISPTSTGAFSKGVWTGSVILTGASSGVTLFTTGSGMSGTSNSFIVNSGALNHFTFGTVSSLQTSGSGFSITVTANDVYDNIVTSYIGSPSLTVSAGVISPSIMNAFVNGVGSTSVKVTGADSGVTITVADSTYSGVSNSFSVTNSPTTTPTTTNPTSPPSSTSEPTSTPTSTPTRTSTPTAKPSPSPTPLETIVKAKTDNGVTVNLVVSGNVTSVQMSSVTITTSQSVNSTTLSMTVTGESGTAGFSNITIPKTAVLYGTKPVVFIDDQQAANQGYTQDSDNFYVWYTTHFSTRLIKIQFAGLLNTQTSSFEPLLVVGIITPEIVLVYTVIAVRRLRRRPENI